jgi:methionine aminotransferase
MDYQHISSESDSDLAIRLTQEKKLATIPLSVFYKNNPNQQLLRFCFAKKKETLERAAEIICAL